MVSVQEAGPSETDVSSLRTIEQREWELQQQENAYWHEMLVSGYQSRTYQMVSGSNAGTKPGWWWCLAGVPVVGQHRPQGADSRAGVFASAVLGLPMLCSRHRHCSCSVCHLPSCNLAEGTQNLARRGLCMCAVPPFCLLCGCTALQDLCSRRFACMLREEVQQRNIAAWQSVTADVKL